MPIMKTDIESTKEKFDPKRELSRLQPRFELPYEFLPRIIREIPVLPHQESLVDCLFGGIPVCEMQVLKARAAARQEILLETAVIEYFRESFSSPEHALECLHQTLHDEERARNIMGKYLNDFYKKLNISTLQHRLSLTERCGFSLAAEQIRSALIGRSLNEPSTMLKKEGTTCKDVKQTIEEPTVSTPGPGLSNQSETGNPEEEKSSAAPILRADAESNPSSQTLEAAQALVQLSRLLPNDIVIGGDRVGCSTSLDGITDASCSRHSLRSTDSSAEATSSGILGDESDKSLSSDTAVSSQAQKIRPELHAPQNYDISHGNAMESSSTSSSSDSKSFPLLENLMLNEQNRAHCHSPISPAVSPDPRQIQQTPILSCTFPSPMSAVTVNKQGMVNTTSTNHSDAHLKVTAATLAQSPPPVNRYLLDAVLNSVTPPGLPLNVFPQLPHSAGMFGLPQMQQMTHFPVPGVPTMAQPTMPATSQAQLDPRYIHVQPIPYPLSAHLLQQHLGMLLNQQYAQTSVPVVTTPNQSLPANLRDSVLVSSPASQRQRDSLPLDSSSPSQVEPSNQQRVADLRSSALPNTNSPSLSNSMSDLHVSVSQRSSLPAGSASPPERLLRVFVGMSDVSAEGVNIPAQVVRYLRRYHCHCSADWKNLNFLPFLSKADCVVFCVSPGYARYFEECEHHDNDSTEFNTYKLSKESSSSKNRSTAKRSLKRANSSQPVILSANGSSTTNSKRITPAPQISNQPVNDNKSTINNSNTSITTNAKPNGESTNMTISSEVALVTNEKTTNHKKGLADRLFKFFK